MKGRMRQLQGACSKALSRQSLGASALFLTYAETSMFEPTPPSPQQCLSLLHVLHHDALIYLSSCQGNLQCRAYGGTRVSAAGTTTALAATAGKQRGCDCLKTLTPLPLYFRQSADLRVCRPLELDAQERNLGWVAEDEVLKAHLLCVGDKCRRRSVAASEGEAEATEPDKLLRNRNNRFKQLGPTTQPTNCPPSGYAHVNIAHGLLDGVLNGALHAVHQPLQPDLNVALRIHGALKLDLGFGERGAGEGGVEYHRRRV